MSESNDKWGTDSGKEREALSDSGGEGSDVISTSAILLSKSILCLFVFNILPPPSRGSSCVFLSDFRGWGTEERADERLTIWWASSVWSDFLQLTFGPVIIFRELLHFYLFARGFTEFGVLKKKKQQIPILLFSIFPLSCSVNHAGCQGNG